MNLTEPLSPSAKIRAQLDHPVIDADGHTIEYMPAVREHLKDVAGGDLANKVFSHPTGFPDGWYRATPEERMASRRVRPPWWGIPSENTLDRTTSMLPKLMYERLQETGADFAIVYPTIGLMALGTPMDEVRLALCRALNNYHHEAFTAYRDRLSPVAVIPTNTPGEAIAELDYAVTELGFKNVLLCGLIHRPLGGSESRSATYVDHLGIDSLYDYDPVWQRCQELGVAPAFHSGGMGWGSRNSPNNYMFNHVGHFAAACDATCKSLFMAGVTKRLPDMRFAFLEGGTAWAVTLYNDLIGHWKKRNRDAVRRYDPGRLDVGQMQALFESHGDEVFARIEDREGALARLEDFSVSQEREEMIDEWSAIGIERGEDIRDRFVPNFYFGCEADDPMNALAFDARLNGYGAKLQAIFSSDVGHWDVPDIREVLEEAYELVDNGFLSEEDFRDFVFGHAVRLYTHMNKDYFEGTAVADAARADAADL